MEMQGQYGLSEKVLSKVAKRQLKDNLDCHYRVLLENTILSLRSSLIIVDLP